MMRRLLRGSVFVLAGCGAGSRPDQADTAPMRDTMTVVGIVKVVGADPLAQLIVQAEGGEATALVGPLQSELHQTVGLEVRVTGVTADAVPPARTALEVRSYETVSLNGAAAHTGTLERSGDGYRLVGTTRGWTLVNPPEELRASVGAKAWVAGEVSGDTLRVTAYGIIRRAASP